MLRFSFLISLCVGLLIIFLLPPGASSIDLQRYLSIVEILGRGGNPYIETNYLNYAPAWMQVLWFIGRLAGADPARQEIFIKLLNCLAVGMLCMLLSWATNLAPNPRKQMLLILFGITLNPALLLIAYVHASFDPVLMLATCASLVLLAQAERMQDVTTWLAAAFVLGLAILLKPVPIVYLPLLFIPYHWLPKRARCFGIILSISPFIISLSVIYALAPKATIANVLQYSSVPGYFGLTGLFFPLSSGQTLIAYYSWIFKSLLPIALTFAAICINRCQSESSYLIIFRYALLATLTLIIIGPGFGTQYLFWLAPLAILRSYFPPCAKAPIIATLLIANVTLLYEYLRFPILSGTLATSLGSAEVMHPTITTLIRMPLYLCLLWWLMEDSGLAAMRQLGPLRPRRK
ncbi:MAG: hypothetical protein K1X79_12625 [Oligoflexia bacterium]|nr:hypothetical protein [Oligoflexia bacterium]